MDANFQPVKDGNTRHFLLKAKQHMYNSRELCLFDLNKINEVVEHFVNNDDVNKDLKRQSSFLLNLFNRIINY